MSTELMALMWVVIVLSIPLLIVSYLRATRPHSRTMSKVQAQLNKKTGASSGTSTTAPTSTGGNENIIYKLKSNIWIVLLVVGGGVVLWGFYRPVHVTDVMRLRDYWFSLVILWGVVATLIALNAGKVAGTLQWILSGVMLALLIALPVWSWIVTPSESSQQAQQQARPVVTMPANGDSVHVSPDTAGYITVFTGDGFEHHIVYAGGKDCVVGNTEDPCKDGPILYQYVRDTTGKPNSATYKFVR